VFVLDEADTFFLGDKHKAELDYFIETLNKLKDKVQFVFFSATFEKKVEVELSEYIKDAI
jgi:superfamily II DNA/RNA helicase